MESIEELWRSSGSDTVDLLLSRSSTSPRTPISISLARSSTRLIDLAPRMPRSGISGRQSRFLRKDYAGALADLRHSLNLDPRNYRRHERSRHHARSSRRQKKEALEAYRKALKANPFLDEARDAVKELTHEVEGQDI